MKEQSAVLVTGGAGYIGSHVVRQLAEVGERVIVLDNLSTGFAESVLHGDLIVGDTGDRETVLAILRENRVDAVMHFAAHTVVPESVRDPLKYYRNNTSSTRTLLECCREAGVRHFVFSSTAAVYGMPDDGFASEDTPTLPINPYGRSKLMSEWMLHDLALVTDLNYVAFRYFNVAGCDPYARIGQSTPNATLLIKVACETAIGKRSQLKIFGTDYPTPDGTGVRDFIHVEDLADAHRLGLEYLRNDGDSSVFNCGYGHGYSVREVLDSVQRVTGKSLTIEEAARRPVDPPRLIADTGRLHQRLGWKPRYDDLDFIVETAWNWERRVSAPRSQGPWLAPVR